MTSVTADVTDDIDQVYQKIEAINATASLQNSVNGDLYKGHIATIEN